MTPYNHLRSQHYVAQLARHTTFNTYWLWPRGGSRPSRVETFPRSHPETTFQVYKHLDLTGNRTQVDWIEIQSANHYTTDPRVIGLLYIITHLPSSPYIYHGAIFAVSYRSVGSFEE